jgi:CheY-like chemotaxis protein
MTAGTKMEVIKEIIHVSPTYAVLIFASILLFVYRKHVRRLLRNANHFEILGLKLIAPQALHSASDLAKEHGLQAISPRRQEQVLKMLDDSRDYLDRTEILWVDDNPYNCFDEARVLQSFGAIVSFVTRTEEARMVLVDRTRPSRIGLIITDMDRSDSGDGPNAGVELIQELTEAEVDVPIIVYTGTNRSKPSGAYALAIGPDKLIEHIVSALRGSSEV